MRPHRTGRVWMLGLFVAGLLLALSPPAAWAGIATATLYETMESPPAHAAPGGPDIPGTFPPGIGGRLATATEAGIIQGSGDLGFLTGNMTVHAQSRVGIDASTGFLGTGTISGSFEVKPPTGGAAVPAKLDGTIDLSTVYSGYASTSGSWSTLGKKKISGDFSGLFLIPINGAMLGYPADKWFYLDVDKNGCFTGGVTLLGESEFRKGVPLIKLLVTLTTPPDVAPTLPCWSTGTWD